MEYQINELASLAGVSARTLRYYDEIGLLKPSRITEANYRMYTEKEVDLLQQILFYRSLELKLEDIKKIITSPGFDVLSALQEHQQHMEEKIQNLQVLLETIKHSIAYQKGEITMTNQEKFIALKKEAIEKNEATYGTEIRQKYGEDTINKSNEKYLNLTKEEYNTMEETEANLLQLLKHATSQEVVDGATKTKIYALHKQWLSYSWPKYDKKAHAGLANMYLADERFQSYYNNKVNHPNATTILVDAIQSNCN